MGAIERRTYVGILLERLYLGIRTGKRIWSVSRYAKKRIKMIGGGYKGSAKEYRNTVVKYWKKYGVKPKRYWYTLLCNGKDAYDPRYIPDSIWYGEIQPYFNNLMFRNAYADKSTLSLHVPGVKKPETIVKNIAGYFFNGDGECPITREEALALCKNETELIFKPSIETGGGASIQFYDKKTMDETTIDDYFNEYKSNFVVQKILKQHPDLARIHKESLNTVRVISFHFNDEVHILSTMLRMGSGGSKVDNISAGGCACLIKPDGWLAEKSVTRKSTWTDEHPSGIKFKDVRVPSFDKIIENVKRLHKQLPYFNIIGWDFAVDETGEPVMVEFNITPEPNQIAAGPTFGDLTEAVLEEVYIKKNLRRTLKLCK